METLLWALDLVGVVYLCFWALGQDQAKPGSSGKPGKPASPARTSSARNQSR